MRWLITVLIVLLVTLQARLWFGEGGLPEVHRLHDEVERQRSDNQRLRARNRVLEAVSSDTPAAMLTYPDLQQRSGRRTERCRELDALEHFDIHPQKAAADDEP